MGVYSEYIERNFDFEKLSQEREKQLKRISEIRGRDILVYAADLNNTNPYVRTSIDYSDLLPIKDQLANLKKKQIDLILETPGGSGEVAEDIVELIRQQFDDFAVIIPGWAKSAGTLIAMAADEILMDYSSALGPIDAQLIWQGKVFSADALIEGMDKIKKEVNKTDKLNKAYIPILQGISPGELQSAQNALDFAKLLVTEWLAKYKFKNWLTHSSTGKSVTKRDRNSRAKKIAKVLCDHKKWKTHGRSIKIEDLEQMRLKIFDYSKHIELCDAIHRYHTLLQMTFATNTYKLFETPSSQISRFYSQNKVEESNVILISISCNNCGEKMKVQANLGAINLPLEQGNIAFPENNKLKCKQCGIEIDLTNTRRQLEAQSGKKIFTPQIKNEKQK